MCILAASEGRDNVPEGEMPVGASGGVYPPLDPQSKSEVGTETETSKVAEPAVTLQIRNLFLAGLTDGNKGDGDSVDLVAVVDGEGKLQGKKGTYIPYYRKYFHQKK